jgi:hypothetical protein
MVKVSVKGWDPDNPRVCWYKSLENPEFWCLRMERKAPEKDSKFTFPFCSLQVPTQATDTNVNSSLNSFIDILRNNTLPSRRQGRLVILGRC